MIEHRPAPEFVRAMGPVARDILGEPTEENASKNELRFGTNGSLSVTVAAGTWYDHEAKIGGGVIDFVQSRKGLDKNGAVEWLREKGHLQQATKPSFKIVAHYSYTDADGQLLYEVCRRDPKDFRQRRPDGAGKWIWNVKGVGMVLYHLPDVIAAVQAGRVIYITEGEKSTDALTEKGLTATCSPGGANKWRKDFAKDLVGADVVILPDNDVAGQSHGVMVAGSLQGKAKRIRVLNLPDLPAKGDVFDWIAGGGTAAKFTDLVANAPDYRPTMAVAPVSSSTIATPDLDQNGVVVGINGQDLTEDGVALAFVAIHQDDLRYDHTRGAWFHWTGKSWRPDETKLAFSWARRVCRLAAKQVGAEGKVLLTMGKAATAASVERFAQSDPALAVTSVIWDSDPFMLGTPGGTVDLRTGKIRKSVPEDHITKLTAAQPGRSEDCPQWIEFLHQVTGGDNELVRFLQQWCGYCLTGDTREHALLFAHGPGGNGKGVFLKTVSHIMGDYARNAAMETFTASTSDKHPTDLAMLRGARLVTASETEEGQPWAEARIKALTGGDIITARFMRQDFFEYEPQFKLTIIGNHKPVLKNIDEAARRRFNIIPFLYKPLKKDLQLEAKLQKEAPAILQWMIDGCLDWQKDGLVRPAVVLAATAEYFSEQDTVRQWVDESCDVRANQSETQAALFKSWTDYALANGEKPGTTMWFKDCLTRMGCEAVKHTPGSTDSNGKRGFKGISLKALVVPPSYHDRN